MRAHPRSRGDHMTLGTPPAPCAGSSPLARGPLRGAAAADTGAGLIPARAGTTTSPCPQGRRTRAHPRSRGDHSTNGQAIPGVEGSSPLARGPLAQEHQYFPGRGLIPARAGTTRTARPVWGCDGAHPRSRGDHLQGGHPHHAQAGSSPLARGPRDAHWDRLVSLGLIPARAGTTSPSCSVQKIERAHPRSRGDHALPESTSIPPKGSSPLARGPRGG